MNSIYRISIAAFLICGQFADISFAQEKRNSTVYPYGGMPDSSRFESGRMFRVPLNFKKAAFDSAHFDRMADFSKARFDSETNFKWAQFDLDYLFATSAIFQKVSDEYKQYSAFYPFVWWQFLYSATMGLGYRPFRLIWWVLGLVLSFGIYYMIKMPNRINGHIAKDEAQRKSSRSEKKSEDENKIPLTDTIIHCLYFSAMVLFTFRLKRDILTFFTTREKRVIVSQWLLGFLIYVAFLTLSKSGSILHNLKDLFIG